MNDDQVILDALVERLGIKRVARLLVALDEIWYSTGYGSVKIEIRDRRVEFIETSKSEDMRCHD